MLICITQGQRGALLYEGEAYDALLVAPFDEGIVVLRRYSRELVKLVPTSELDIWRQRYESIGLACMDHVAWLDAELQVRRSKP